MQVLTTSFIISSNFASSASIVNFWLIKLTVAEVTPSILAIALSIFAAQFAQSKSSNLLGDYSRLRIFLLIAERERSVKEIVEITRLTQSNVSHHLKLLRENELVQSCRVGKSIIYTLSKQFKLSPLFELFPKINYGRK